MTATYFASPDKTDEKELAVEIKTITNNPLVSGLLDSVSGLMAVVDEHRQVVAVNYTLLEMLNIDKPEEVLGLRTGKMLNCIHAEDGPSGCGTTKFCSTCGAAIAIVTSLSKNEAVEKICSISTKRDNQHSDIVLRVRSHPVEIDKKRYLLLFLQDITQQHQRAALERTFFHDINNLLGVLIGGTEILLEKKSPQLVKAIHQASLRIRKEVEIQRCLSQSYSSDYEPLKSEITPKQVVDELKSFFTSHPVAKNKNIEFQENYPEILINTDLSLLLRVLCNMLLNALEATLEGGIVKFWLERKDSNLCFKVWNKKEIPQKITNRIFQRNFTTKNQDGRGIGTFSMKLFGERYLGGKINFKTSPEEGTVFNFSLPLDKKPNDNKDNPNVENINKTIY